MIPNSLFSRTGHLLYVQTTDICGMNCEFCMYGGDRRGLDLLIEGKARKNLVHLVNESSRIGISGQGEPLNNPKALFDLLEMGSGGKTFDLVTSGNVRWDVLHSLINRATGIVRLSGDRLRIRVSLDHFHLPRLKHSNILFLLEWMMEENKGGSPVELFFRSITVDKKLVKEYLGRLLLEAGHEVVWNCSDPLKYEMRVQDYVSTVEFGSLVDPGRIGARDIYTPEDYIGLLERKFGRPFTLGNMETDSKPGLDVTINPDGGVVFYGLESEEIANIYTDEVRYEDIDASICRDPFHSTFIRVPFRVILARLRKNKALSSRIDQINNPYWIVRRLYEEWPEQLRKAVLSI